jgi:hypothetical protein
MARTTNKRYGYKVNPYEFTPSHIKGLKRMAKWYGEVEGNTFFEIHMGWGQLGSLRYTGEDWGEYIMSYIGRESYGESGKSVLNELRSIYLQYIGEK